MDVVFGCYIECPNVHYFPIFPHLQCFFFLYYVHWLPSSHNCVFWWSHFPMTNESFPLWYTKVANLWISCYFFCRNIIFGLWTFFVTWYSLLLITNQCFASLTNHMTLLPFNYFLFKMTKYTHYQTPLCEHWSYVFCPPPNTKVIF